MKEEVPITIDNMLADDTDTVLGGESLYCTMDDELAIGKDLKLAAKDLVFKLRDTHLEKLRAV